jgi:hypothetical protein
MPHSNIQPEHSGGNPEKRQRRDAGQPVTRIDDKGDADCSALTRRVSASEKAKKEFVSYAYSAEYSHILRAEASSVRQFKV